jgi:hypothetical protein
LSSLATLARSFDIGKILAVIIAIGFVIYMAGGRKEPTEPAPAPKVAEVLTPEAFVRKAIAGSEVRVDGDTIYVNIRVLTRSSSKKDLDGAFGASLRHLVPDLFEKFPELTYVKVTGHDTFVDRRGNESDRDLIAVVFSRQNAATIQWKNILISNAPSLADDLWVNWNLVKP